MLSVRLVQGVGKKSNQPYYAIETSYTYNVCGEVIQKSDLKFIDKPTFLLINETLKKEEK